MYKVVFFLFSLALYFNQAGTQTMMTDGFDATSQYKVKAVDSLHSGTRFDTIVFFAPVQSNGNALLSFGVKSNNAAMDSCYIYVNGAKVFSEVLTANLESFHDIQIAISKAMLPNKIMIRFKTEGANLLTGMKFYVRPLWIKS